MGEKGLNQQFLGKEPQQHESCVCTCAPEVEARLFDINFYINMKNVNRYRLASECVLLHLTWLFFRVLFFFKGSCWPFVSSVEEEGAELYVKPLTHRSKCTSGSQEVGVLFTEPEKPKIASSDRENKAA